MTRLFKGIDGCRPSSGRIKVGSDEHSQQVIVCDALDVAGIAYFAVPNGVNVSKRERAKLVAEGMKAGVLDIIIVTPPPARPGALGTALAMKRATWRAADVPSVCVAVRTRWRGVAGRSAEHSLQPTDALPIITQEMHYI